MGDGFSVTLWDPSPYLWPLFRLEIAQASSPDYVKEVHAYFTGSAETRIDVEQGSVELLIAWSDSSEPAHAVGALAFSERGPEKCLVEAVGVSINLQGLGIVGPMLLKQLRAVASERGYREVVWRIHKDNQPSESFGVAAGGVLNERYAHESLLQFSISLH